MRPNTHLTKYPNIFQKRRFNAYYWHNIIDILCNIAYFSGGEAEKRKCDMTNMHVLPIYKRRGYFYKYWNTDKTSRLSLDDKLAIVAISKDACGNASHFHHERRPLP
jgi:hypothetical protein